MDKDPREEDRANLERIAALAAKGVRFPEGTAGIHVAEDVDPARMEAGVTIHGGARISGAKTLLRAGAEIGRSGPCVLRDMVLDREVRLGSGFFEDSVLLARCRLGDNVRVRENCLLEEGCENGFSVDVKHTFLLAHVILGSEINFCDLLMAGGTSRKDHSEVGSGTIHYNFTPFGASGDKATASLIGDVVHGVFYRAPRIFVGGHVSLVGPLRIGYGAVVAAGSRVTRDVPEGVLTFGDPGGAEDRPAFDFLRYRSIARKVAANVAYIAQLGVLWHWYNHARRIASAGSLGAAVTEAALEKIARGLETRVARMDAFHGYMEESIARNRAAGDEKIAVQQETFRTRWPAAREALLRFKETEGDTAARDAFLEPLAAAVSEREDNFPARVRSLDDRAVAHGVQWLESIAHTLDAAGRDLAPALA